MSNSNFNKKMREYTGILRYQDIESGVWQLQLSDHTGITNELVELDNSAIEQSDAALLDALKDSLIRVRGELTESGAGIFMTAPVLKVEALWPNG